MYADALSSYPAYKQLCQLQFDQWFEFGLQVGLTEEDLHSVEKDQNPTASTLLAAKIKNVELQWKDIIQSLVKIGEYQQAESVCTEQG